MTGKGSRKRKASGPGASSRLRKTKQRPSSAPPARKYGSDEDGTSNHGYEGGDDDGDGDGDGDGISDHDYKDGDADEEQREASDCLQGYADNTIHPDTVQFLRELSKHNDRDWFHAHKGIYKAALGDFTSFCRELQVRVTQVDWTVPVLPLERHNIFRIYRDVRFSASKVPYKEYFSVAFSRTGKQGQYAKYYLSLQSGDQSFIGGGLWHPDATHLSLMRRAIDRNPRGLKDILVSKDFYANFLDAGSANSRKPQSAKKVEEQALTGFLSRNSEDALKTTPKGYERGHPDIGLLRLKSYTVGKRIPDSDILLPNVMEQLVGIVRVLEPFITYLNSVVLPDVNLGQTTNQAGEQEEEEEDDDDDDE